MSSTNLQTGPTTPAGKEISSQNATTHGGTSEKLIVAGECRQDFDHLLATLSEEFQPAAGHARQLIHDAACARWFLWRRIRACNSVEDTLYSAQPDPALWTEDAYHKLALVERYKTTAERALQRALNNLETLRKNRLGEHKWETKSTLDRERFEMQKERHAIAIERDLRRRKKEELQNELAVAEATQQLEKRAQAVVARELERERAAWFDACQGFGKPTLVQKIYVDIKKNRAVTKMSPSNDELLPELDRELYPPVQVARQFHFKDGIPPEYHWLTSDEKYRKMKGYQAEQTMDIDTWLALTGQEAENPDGHALPGADYESPEDC